MGHHSVTEGCKTGSASDLVEVESHDFNRGSVSTFFTTGVAGKAPKGNTPRDFIVKTPDYEREFWLSDNINSRKAILPDKSMWRVFKDIYFYISTSYDAGNDGVPFAELLPEERINAAAYYVEEHFENWTTLLRTTVPYVRYTDVPNTK